MMEMLKWGVAAMLLTLFATAQASADGDAGRGKMLFTRCSSCHAVTEQLVPSSTHRSHSLNDDQQPASFALPVRL